MLCCLSFFSTSFEKQFACSHMLLDFFTFLRIIQQWLLLQRSRYWRHSLPTSLARLLKQRRANFYRREGWHAELLPVPFGVRGVNAVLALEFPWQQISRSSSKAAFEDARQQSVTGRKTEQRVGGGKKTDRESERGYGNLLSLLDK